MSVPSVKYDHWLHKQKLRPLDRLLLPPGLVRASRDHPRTGRFLIRLPKIDKSARLITITCVRHASGYTHGCEWHEPFLIFWRHDHESLLVLRTGRRLRDAGPRGSRLGRRCD